MQQIVALSKDPKDHNQITRWVMNKEAHCDEFQHIVTQYFMTQRVKPLTPEADQATKTKYVTQLTLLHEMLVYAMKAKQTTDTANTDKLKQLVHDFEHDYFGTSR
jgi:nickel superoxide dismutase